MKRVIKISGIVLGIGIAGIAGIAAYFFHNNRPEPVKNMEYALYQIYTEADDGTEQYIPLGTHAVIQLGADQYSEERVAIDDPSHVFTDRMIQTYNDSLIIDGTVGQEGTVTVKVLSSGTRKPFTIVIHTQPQ